MQRLKYRVKACSPLIISKISGDMNMISTEQHIPGTAVLGLLAGRFLQMEKGRINPKLAHEDNDFFNLFLNGGLKVCNAYIISQDEYGEYGYYPTPFSIEKDKYGIDTYDRLWRRGNIGESTEYVGDFCRFDDDTVWTKTTQTNINFHHARDAETGAPKMSGQKGVIFNYESINSNQIFEGELIGKERDLKRLTQICGMQWPAFVGRSRNAQYGAVEFSIINEAPEIVHNRIEFANEDEKKEEGSATIISMTLTSNMILYNEFGYAVVDVVELKKELNKHLGKVNIQNAFVKKTEVENFVGIWQLKKPSETSFAAGSTFLLNIEQPDIARLEELTQNGIGERTHEGFGRCLFGIQNPPIDIKKQPTISLRNEADDEVVRKRSKPKYPIPEIAKNSITEIVKEIITEKIELKAINDQDNFDNLPSRALISRLNTISNIVENEKQLAEQVQNFRQIALDQLDGCACRDYTLREFLTKHKPVNWDDFFRAPQNAKIKSLCEEIGFNPKNDNVFKLDITKRYFSAFFSMMRKQTIAESEGSHDK